MIKLLRSSLLYSLLIPLLLLTHKATAQREIDRNSVVDFGLGLRTVVNSDLLSGGTFSSVTEGVTFSYSPRVTMAIDANIRFKLRGRFSLQTGISSVRRGYFYSMEDNQTRFEDHIRLTSFQIPITGIVQVPTSERGKIGLEAGFVLDMLPTDAASGTDSFQSFIYVSNRFNPALRASAFYSQGLQNGGVIEIGAGYHRLLGGLGNFYMDFGPVGGGTVHSRTSLQGHFFYAGVSFIFP